MIGFANTRITAMLLAALIAAGGNLQAATPQDKFFEAYYLETAKGNDAAAAEIYAEVVAHRGVDAQLRAKAQARLDSLREELASTDFARLMPPTALAYVEFNQPGDQLTKLIEQLGLLADEDTQAGDSAQGVAISPALIRELLGIRGAAVAVTAFDPIKQQPAGVAIFHPGDMEIIRALIETGLPLASKSVEPIGGFPTYDIEGEALVTLTSRLIIASPQRAQIEGVIRRLKGDDQTSLLTNDDLAGVLNGRDDALLFFCINAKPILPMLNGILAAGAMHSREMAMARALLDINSLRSLVGRAGITDDGISLDVTLSLDEGHQNLVYNFLRTPAINPETLRSIPAGVAGFLAIALNEPDSKYAAAPSSPAGAPPVITALDFGRELFANITSLAVYALPPTSTDGKTNGQSIPDFGVTLTVHDPARSEALWTQILGIAAIASGAPSIEGTPVTLEGLNARRYQLPENVSIFFATDGNDAMITTTRHAMTQSIRAKRSGNSVLKDPTFAKTISRLSSNTTRALFAHPGRVLEIAKPFMSERDAAEIAPIMPALSETVVSAIVDHSDGAFRFSAEITGIPNISAMVTQLIAKERRQQEERARLTQAISHERWSEALAIIEQRLTESPGSVDLLRKKFNILAAETKDRAAALACGDMLFRSTHNDADSLNRFAWVLLTEQEYEGKYNELALTCSERSNELTELGNWAYVDTLALAAFETGNASRAVELQKKAIELSDGRSAATLQATLARFEKGVQQDKRADNAP